MKLDTHATLNILTPRQNGRHFPDDIFEHIFLNENIWISIKISSKFVPKGLINNIPVLVQKKWWIDYRRITLILKQTAYPLICHKTAFDGSVWQKW